MEYDNVMEQANNMVKTSQKIEAVKADIEALNVLRETLKNALAAGVVTNEKYSEQLEILFKALNHNRDLLNNLYNGA